MSQHHTLQHITTHPSQSVTVFPHPDALLHFNDLNTRETHTTNQKHPFTLSAPRLAAVSHADTDRRIADLSFHQTCNASHLCTTRAANRGWPPIFRTLPLRLSGLCIHARHPSAHLISASLEMRRPALPSSSSCRSLTPLQDLKPSPTRWFALASLWCLSGATCATWTGPSLILYWMRRLHGS